MYVLEALANGVPVVQPRHGSFPELIEATGGGLLVNPDDPADLARGLRQLLENPAQRAELGRKGKEAVQQRFHADRMARETVDVYSKYVKARAAGFSLRNPAQASASAHRNSEAASVCHVFFIRMMGDHQFESMEIPATVRERLEKRALEISADHETCTSAFFAANGHRAGTKWPRGKVVFCHASNTRTRQLQLLPSGTSRPASFRISSVDGQWHGPNLRLITTSILAR